MLLLLILAARFLAKAEEVEPPIPNEEITTEGVKPTRSVDPDSNDPRRRRSLKGDFFDVLQEGKSQFLAQPRIASGRKGKESMNTGKYSLRK